jgi:RNA polymerase sigma factor (sigma-70 family)
MAEHMAPVRAALRHAYGRSVSAEDINDAICEAMARLWSGRKAYRLPEAANLRGLLYVVARNKLVDVLRAREQERSVMNDLSRAMRFSSDPTGASDGARERLRQAVSSLSPREQAVLGYWTQAGNQADWTPLVVKHLGLSSGNARVILHRALHKLRALVTPSVSKGERRSS